LGDRDPQNWLVQRMLAGSDRLDSLEWLLHYDPGKFLVNTGLAIYLMFDIEQTSQLTF